MRKLIILITLTLVACGQNPHVSAPSNGSNGTNGINGTNGHSAAFSSDVADSSVCANGGEIINMGVDANDDNALEPSEITHVSVICNGLNGAQGAQGATGATGAQGATGSVPQFTPVVTIMPCGANSSSYKEVLLGLAGGAIFSEFSGDSNALNTRNILVPDGGYYDTDSSQCYFNVSTDAQGNRTVSWSGATANGSGPWHAGSASYNAITGNWSVNY